MNTYAQSGEDLVVAKYFGDYKGTLIEIGSNDGKTLSNSLALIELGWSATLVEPSPIACEKLIKLHIDNENVLIYNVAAGEKQERQEFWESGSHLGNGDTSLLSTLSSEEIKRWLTTDTEFTKTEVDVVPIKALMMDFPVYDFISIDAEGFDLVILKGIDLLKVGCKCICIEWNSKPEIFNEISDYMTPLGYKVIHANAENLIWAL